MTLLKVDYGTDSILLVQTYTNAPENSEFLRWMDGINHAENITKNWEKF
jgi:hypothetical protein